VAMVLSPSLEGEDGEGGEREEGMEGERSINHVTMGYSQKLRSCMHTHMGTRQANTQGKHTKGTNTRRTHKAHTQGKHQAPSQSPPEEEIS
jgi:hypothetical protein